MSSGLCNSAFGAVISVEKEKGGNLSSANFAVESGGFPLKWEFPLQWNKKNKSSFQFPLQWIKKKVSSF